MTAVKDILNASLAVQSASILQNNLDYLKKKKKKKLMQLGMENIVGVGLIPPTAQLIGGIT